MNVNVESRIGEKTRDSQVSGGAHQFSTRIIFWNGLERNRCMIDAFSIFQRAEDGIQFDSRQQEFLRDVGEHVARRVHR